MARTPQGGEFLMAPSLIMITVGNGTKDYPGNFTKKEQQLILGNTVGAVCNIFSGKSYIGEWRIDFACPEATLNMDVFKWLERVNWQQYEMPDCQTVIIDAPYNQKFADKYQKIGDTPDQFIIFANAKKTTFLFDSIIEKINPLRIIIKSWNYYVPKGYEDVGSYLCYAGGYRKPTIIMVCELPKVVNF